MSNPLLPQIFDFSSSHSFTLAFRPRVQQPTTTPETLPRQEPTPPPQDGEMVDIEPGEIMDEEHECTSHTPESSSRPSTAETRYRSRSPRRGRHGRYRDRSRSYSPIREQSRGYRRRDSPVLHPTGGWEADHYSPERRRTNPRSRGARVSDRYRPPPKTFKEVFERMLREADLKKAGAPVAPKALREQAEEQSKTNALVAEGVPEGPRSSEICHKRQGVAEWFPHHRGGTFPGRRSLAMPIGKRGIPWDNGDKVRPSSCMLQNDGRLFRPDSIDGQDEEMDDRVNTNEKVPMEDEPATEPSSGGKGTKLKSTFNQLKFWIADQPVATARPLPTVHRSYPASYSQDQEFSRVLHSTEDLSTKVTQTQPFLRLPARLQPPPQYPEEELNYD